jgi:translation elongation factor EF-4
MRRVKPPPIRNKIDLSNANEMRVLKKRLGVSDDDLRRVVAKVGNSIVTISKEVELEKERANSQPPLPQTNLSSPVEVVP